MRTVEASGLVHGGHPCTHLSQQLLLRTYRYHFQLAALIPLWLFLSSSTFVQMFLVSSFPFFLFSIIPLITALYPFFHHPVVFQPCNPEELQASTCYFSSQYHP